MFNRDKYPNATGNRENTGNETSADPPKNERPCLRCDGSMTAGFIPDYWQSADCQEMVWVAGSPTVNNNVIAFRTRRIVVAYRCPLCGTLELVAE